jgi:hypothetical protein
MARFESGWQIFGFLLGAALVSLAVIEVLKVSTRGQCYDHQFQQFLPIFGVKISVLLKNNVGIYFCTIYQCFESKHRSLIKIPFKFFDKSLP